MPPLRLTDSQLAAVSDSARNIRPRERARFMENVASLLHDRADVGDGDVHRAVRAAMAMMERERSAWLDPQPDAPQGPSAV